MARCKLREARGLAKKLSREKNAPNERAGDEEEGNKPAAFQIWVAAGRERKGEVGGRLGAVGTHREDRGSNKAGSKGRKAWAG